MYIYELRKKYNFFNSYKNDLLLYRRYVDDCILIPKKDKTKKILSSFNVAVVTSNSLSNVNITIASIFWT